MARLYPPVTEEVLPAFCLTLDKNGEKEGALINVNFNLNKAVAATEISGIVMRLRTISTNTYVVTENTDIANSKEGYAYIFNLIAGTCSFSITQKNSPDAMELLKVGQYYKIQLAFVDLNGSIGYWSTVATIKCVAKPNVIIANYNANDVNIFSNEILGEYIQDTSTGDSSEKAYSYQFKIYDSQDNIIADTGIKLHNSSSDISSFSSTDLFKCYESLKEDEIYYAEYIVTTINGLTVSSPRYQIIAMELIDPEEDLTLMVRIKNKKDRMPNVPRNGWPEWEPWEEGLIEIYPDLNGHIDNNITPSGTDKTVTGNFVISRASSKDNFSSWEEIRRFRLSNEVPSSKIIYDQTVEQGITYRYCLQQYNRSGFYSRRVYSYKRNESTGEVLYNEFGEPILNDITADFEDMFLYDGVRQLKVRFNPKVASFKNDLQEQKIDTIGSKHPFIFRNGNVCYKEFPVAGLISFQQDNAKFFINDEDYRQMNLSRFDEVKRSDSDEDKAKLIYSKTDLTSDNIATERYFKLLVLDWLTDGKPKLFRSPTEGNYIVRLLNVSLTPKTELGRMIHEFTCTAYEIADFNYETLLSLGLLSINEPIQQEILLSTNDIKDLLNSTYDEEGFYPINLNGNLLKSFTCVGFAPGDQIRVYFANNLTPEYITIGTTGTYIYDGSQDVIGIAIKPTTDPGDFERSIQLAVKGYINEKFDTIAAINLHTQVGDQLVGPVNGFFAPKRVGIDEGFEISPNVYLTADYDAPKVKVIELLHLHGKRREVIPIFALNDSQITNNTKFRLTPFGNGFIRQKSIAQTKFNTEYGNLSPEELTRAMEVQDLVEVFARNCWSDIFCLFEVYVPNEGETNWVKYKDKVSGGLWGIYDPYLYQKRLKEGISSPTGWWSKSQPYYTPSFTFHYATGENVIVSVESKTEQTYQKIKTPFTLDVGNGAVIDLIYRVQYIDYTIERENEMLKDLRNKYLATKAAALENMQTYNINSYLKGIGQELQEKYLSLLREAEDAENYSAVIELLAEKGNEDQEKKIITYLKNEQSLVNSILYQLSILDMELIDFNDDYVNSDIRILKPNGLLLTGKQNYINNKINYTDTHIANFPSIHDYEDSNGAAAKQYIINTYLNRITRSFSDVTNGGYNFPIILSNIILQYDNEITRINNELSNIGTQQYIGQYLNTLQINGKKVFFNDTNLPAPLSDSWSITTPDVSYDKVYKIAHKVIEEGTIDNIKNTDITLDDWWDYFYSEDLPYLTYRNNNNNNITIDNLNYYENTFFNGLASDCFLGQTLSFMANGKNYTNKQYSLIGFINALLTEISNTQADITSYTNKYGTFNKNQKPDPISGNTPFKTKYLLGGEINANYGIITSQLENLVSNLILGQPDITIENALTNLHRDNLYNKLTDTGKVYFDNYVTWYLTSADDTSVSPYEIFQDIKTFCNYYTLHRDTLTENQKSFIETQITGLKVQIQTSYNTFQENAGVDINSIGQYLEAYLTAWVIAWDQAKSIVDNATSNAETIAVLQNVIEVFNNMISIVNNAKNEFRSISNEYINLKNNYSPSNNIKEILWKQKEFYTSAKNEIQDILTRFNNTYSSLDDDVLLEGYFEFLDTYILSKNNETTNVTATYRQLLTEANAMANTEVIPAYAPEKQQANITNDWKTYLQALAEVYNTEVKERFD